MTHNFIILSSHEVMVTCIVHAGSLCAPEEEWSESTQTTITIHWSFYSTTNTTFTIAYGTTPGELVMTSSTVVSQPDKDQYSIQLTSLEPGKLHYYQILSSNRFTNQTDVERNISTKDSSKFLERQHMMFVTTI